MAITIELRGAVADEHLVDGDTGDALLLGVLLHRLARREQALAVGVAGGLGQVVDDVLHDLLGRVEAERREVADVELDDAVALFLHLAGARQHRATDVVADVGQLGRLHDQAGVAGGRQLTVDGGVHGMRCALEGVLFGARHDSLTRQSGQPMKLHLQKDHELYLVGAIEPAADDRPAVVTVRGQRWSGAVLLQARAAPTAWPVAAWDELAEHHFAALLGLAPDVVLVGTGARQRFAHPRLYAALTAAQVGVDCMDTAAACRTYNILAGEERAVVALLFVE
jgi:uncharacterized protein